MKVGPDTKPSPYQYHVFELSFADTFLIQEVFPFRGFLDLTLVLLLLGKLLGLQMSTSVSISDSPRDILALVVHDCGV